ncbi:MarR family winged helix-turn-helix transcriptional regulator [Noviherbaspirillum sp. Root189]|uniref:MarR family winged helix-turn-helix transcriptional regulator n=1 Tax=Noviherbaspirillum sp. Root189 TaxID=1736487 RepID=UPI00070FF26B|nr:MarR family transcriptional regulator [Noviherbaspirillum sp. Root189]KRB88527.1 MarR family transcriptional regulator [Noviherbaspirillum sp. Root189]
MIKERYLRSIRLLAECFHAFQRISDTHVRKLGLTPAQFDIIATLGNTPGMSFKELGDKTLITKGTLTGIVDRLEEKSLVIRSASMEDRRSMIVRLTDKGQAEFERLFAPHIQFCKQTFLGYSDEDFVALDTELTKLKRQLDSALAAPGVDSCSGT